VSLPEFPLSDAQRQQWFQAELAPGSPAYNIAWALRLRGSLDIPAWRRAVGHVTRRHQPLRTRLVSRAGTCTQQVLDAAAIPDPVTVEDIPPGPPAGRLADAWRRASALAAEPFDLSQAGLIRIHLLPVGPRDHLVVLVAHHIVFDGWSSRVLERDLAECYRAELAGQDPELPELTVSYGEYAAAQAARAGSGLEADLRYWDRQLAGAVPLSLRADFPRPPVMTLRGARETFTPGLALFDNLAALTRSRRASPYSGFLAAVAVLMFRYTGITDVTIGTTALGRPRPELADLIGMFAQSLVLRLPVRPTDSFHDVIGRAHEVVLDALDHAEAPLDLLIRRLRVPRDLSHNPLFQVSLSYLDETVTTPAAFPGLLTETMELPTGSAHFDLTFSLVKRPGALDGAIDYSTDLYRPQTVSRWAAGFLTLLGAAVSAPGRPIAALDLMAAGHRRELLELGRHDW
jgi:Condensation domain